MKIYKCLIILAVFLPMFTAPSTLTGTQIIENIAKEEGVDPKLMLGIAHTESKFVIKTINKWDVNSPSYGMFQIKLATAKAMGFQGNKKDLMDFKTNAKYASKYLKYQLNRYNGDIHKAVCAYNAGTYKARTSKIAVNEVYYKKVIEGSKINIQGKF